MAENFYDSECITLFFDAETGMAEAVWDGFISGSDLRTAVHECVRLLNEKKPISWLADNRKLKALRMSDEQWLAENLIPILAASSLKKMATVISEDIFNQMAIENLHTKASGTIKFEHQYFDIIEAAREWILQ